jgi:putative flippase GtrA
MLKREAGIFLIVGFLTVLIDYLTYRALMTVPALEITYAKGFAFVAGTLFAYFANRFWTFGHLAPKRRSVVRFALVYALTLSINVTVNALVLSISDNVPYAFLAAFLIATTVSACLNFVGMKYFVFVRPASMEAA